jgi:hypothetical protein
MPKSDLTPEDNILEQQLIDTFLVGHREWRPDLQYPQSYSDMQGGMRAVMEHFAIKRRPIAKSLKKHCHICRGSRRVLQNPEQNTTHFITCPNCKDW